MNRLFLQRLYRKIANSSGIRWLYSERYLLLHAIQAERVNIEKINEFNVNTIDDLAGFEQTERWLTRESFLTEAKRRIEEDGMLLYTVVAHGVLVHYAWLVPRQSRSWFPYVQQYYDYPENTAVLFNAYTHPAARGTGLHSRSMMRRVRDGATQPGARWIYTAIESHNRISRATAARCGLECVDVLYERTRFGRVQRGRLSPTDYFSMVERRD